MFQSLTKSSTSDQQQPCLRFQAQSSICSQYIKLTSQKLYLNEATLFTQANELLQKIAIRQRVKDLSQWDVFSTRDSVVLEDDGSFNLSNISVDSKSKLISRKNAMGSRTVRDFDGNINSAINEIEKTCSERTGSLIKKLAEDYKRIKNRTQDNEKKQAFSYFRERNAKINEKLVEELREKQAILTKKIQDLDETISRLKGENSHLKAQNKQLAETADKKSNEIHSQKKIKLYEEIFNNKNIFNTPKKNSSRSLDLISKLVDEKERIASQRFQEIRSIESKLEQTLFKEEENTCEKCCSMLRKMKGSIIAYKSYLEKEGCEFQQMVDSFRSKILAHEKEN